MNRFVRLFMKRFEIMTKRGYDKIYVLVDIHESLMKPTWSRVRSTEFYTFAKETAMLMSEDPEICMIMWSSSLKEDLDYYHKYFGHNQINFDYVNCNPECEDTDYADFKTKLYMDVGLDDKFSFIPEEDWQALHEYFTIRKKLRKI